MNYFEHHIGDYAEATAHLTFVEDAAYSRMIRKYYAQEKPLPVDVKAVQRLVGARTKEEREAVATVLEEFFQLAADGWHNSRCDTEIARFRDGEPEREAKKANEENRLKRHREERAQLFKQITDAGLHAPWNTGITELREMVKRLPKTPQGTLLPPLPATAPATPATATQAPSTITQSPDIKAGSGSSTDSNQDDGGFRSPGELEDDHPTGANLPPRQLPPEPTDPAIRLAIHLRAQGVDAQFTHPAVQDWTTNSVPHAVLDAAIRTARERLGESTKIKPNYLVPIVGDILNPPAASVRGTSAQPSQALPIRKPQGMDPKGTDESYAEYDARITAAENARRRGEAA